jgi:hypothetical protein
MDAAEFLYPTDLTVTKTEISRVLMIGACVADIYLYFLRPLCHGVEFDYILFNNAVEIQDKPQRPVERI